MVEEALEIQNQRKCKALMESTPALQNDVGHVIVHTHKQWTCAMGPLCDGSVEKSAPKAPQPRVTCGIPSNICSWYANDNTLLDYLRTCPMSQKPTPLSATKGYLCSCEILLSPSFLTHHRPCRGLRVRYRAPRNS